MAPIKFAPFGENMQHRTSDRLAGLIKAALCRPVPLSIRGGSFDRSHQYVELAGELQAYLAGRRREDLAAEALRRFEGMQS